MFLFILHSSIYVTFIEVFLLTLLFLWLGFWLKEKLLVSQPEILKERKGVVQGSIMGLMSLLLGFTFSVAMERYETRRLLIVEDVTNLQTAVLRCDLFPDHIRTPLRADFKELLEARIAYYESGGDNVKSHAEIKKAKEISHRIWHRVIVDSEKSEFRIRSQQMIPIVSELMNSITKREAGRTTGVPKLVLYTLLILVLISSMFMGADMHRNSISRIFAFGYAVILTITLNLIIELNNARQGLINLNTTQQQMIELRELFE